MFVQFGTDLTTIWLTISDDDKFATAGQISFARPRNRLSQTAETAEESLAATGRGTVAATVTRRTGRYGGAGGFPAET